MQKGKRNEVVVITGASAGVGGPRCRPSRATRARSACSRAGRAGLEGARRDVERLGGEALVLPTDVADADAVGSAAAAVEEKFGPIDIWVNDAMASVFSPIKDMTAEEFKRVTEVTYLGYGPRHALGLAADAAARSRRDRAGRLGARLSRHPVASRLLRGASTPSRAFAIRSVANCCTITAACACRWCRCRR